MERFIIPSCSPLITHYILLVILSSFYPLLATLLLLPAVESSLEEAVALGTQVKPVDIVRVNGDVHHPVVLQILRLAEPGLPIIRAEVKSRVITFKSPVDLGCTSVDEVFPGRIGSTVGVNI